jgi:hypothetical protein
MWRPTCVVPCRCIVNHISLCPLSYDLDSLRAHCCLLQVRAQLDEVTDARDALVQENRIVVDGNTKMSGALAATESALERERARAASAETGQGSLTTRVHVSERLAAESAEKIVNLEQTLADLSGTKAKLEAAVAEASERHRTAAIAAEAQSSELADRIKTLESESAAASKEVARLEQMLSDAEAQRGLDQKVRVLSNAHARTRGCAPSHFVTFTVGTWCTLLTSSAPPNSCLGKHQDDQGPIKAAPEAKADKEWWPCTHDAQPEPRPPPQCWRLGSPSVSVDWACQSSRYSRRGSTEPRNAPYEPGYGADGQPSPCSTASETRDATVVKPSSNPRRRGRSRQSWSTRISNRWLGPCRLYLVSEARAQGGLLRISREGNDRRPFEEDPADPHFSAARKERPAHAGIKASAAVASKAAVVCAESQLTVDCRSQPQASASDGRHLAAEHPPPREP